MGWELCNTTQTLLDEIADRSATRDDVASTYGLAICSSDETDWAKVNKAITERWSLSALRYIKAAAWKLIDAKKGEQDV